MTEPYVVDTPSDATAAESDYLSALARIVDGKPRHPRLVREASRGAIRPSQSSVAMEAGRSRTPISGSRCSLPRVKVEIDRARRAYDISKRPPSVLARLREEDLLTSLQRECALAKREREEMRSRLHAAYTSAGASTILAAALTRANRLRDADVIAIRRSAEQTALADGLSRDL